MTADKDALVKELRELADTLKFGRTYHALNRAIALLTAPAYVPQVCGACGSEWTGEKCGQADNGHPFATCYPVDAAPLPQSAPVSREDKCRMCLMRGVQCDWCDGGGDEPDTDNDVTGPATCKKCGGSGILAAHPAEPVNEPAGKGEITDGDRYRWLNKQHNFMLYIESESREKKYRLRCGEPLNTWIDQKIFDERIESDHPAAGGKRD